MSYFVIAIVALGLCIPAFAQNSAWEYSTKKDIADKVTELATTLQTSGVGTQDSLIVRCKTACEVYISVGRSIVDDQSSVRLKFSDHAPVRYVVNRGRAATGCSSRTQWLSLKPSRRTVAI
jgi:hypothetical protein